MAIFEIPDVRIAGLSACVPKKRLSNHDYNWITQKERDQLIQMIGVETRHVAGPGQTTSDLCFQAAEQLLDKLEWERGEINLLVFVSQSRDYIIPSTSAILQDRLNLPNTCMAIDINLGCSGYVYGLSVIGSLIRTTGIQKGLLLVGDLSNVTSNYRDKSTYPLFGDAGTATALELKPGYAPMQFNLQTDGSGYDAIIIEDGGVRNLPSKSSFAIKKYGEGIYHNRMQVALNGIEVFNFSLREVVPNIKTTLKHFGRQLDEFDFLVFHQANRLINETIRLLGNRSYRGESRTGTVLKQADGANLALRPEHAKTRKEMIARLGGTLQKDPRWLGFWASFRVDHSSELPKVSGDMQLLQPR